MNIASTNASSQLVRQFIACLALFLSLSFVTISNAATVVKGSGEAEYKGLRPGKDIKRQAVLNAQINAIERHIAGSSQSMLRLLESNRDKVEQNIDKVLLDTKILKEEKNSGLKTYRVVVSAEINVNYLKQILPSSNSAPVGDGEYLTFIFVARDQDSIKSYDARKVVRKQNTQLQDSQDDVSYSGDNVSANASKTQIQQMEVGGSTTQKADKISYAVSSSNEINTAMSQAFTEAGFEVVEAAYLEDETNGQISVRAFKKDYESGEVAPTTMKNAIAGLRDIEIPFFAVGTLDASLPQKDAATGLPKVTVTVTAKIQSLKKRFPKTIASVGPVVYSATGTNATAAKSNALKLAAEKAASTLVTQLQSRGIN